MRKQNFDTKQHFSIRKLTIGAASVLIGTSFYLAGGNIAHADTVPVSDTHTALDKAANETNGVSNEAPSSASAAQSVTDSQAPESNTANDVNTSNVQSKASNSVAPNAVPASSSAATDSSNAVTYPAPNVADWSTITNDQGLEITDYIGQKTDAITIPNTADFVKAGKLQDGQKAEISSLTMRKLVDNGTTKNLKISDTDNAKLYAKDSDWSYTFSVGGLGDIGFMYQVPNDTSDLQNFEYPSKQRVDQINQIDMEIPGGEHNNIELENLDLDNLDTSNITNMFAMFATLETAKSISLKNWDTSNVTNMGFMFINNNLLTHLDGIENFDTSNVTSMDEMFVNTFNLKTSLDLSHWNTSKVKTFYQMFLNSYIPVLNISNWDFATAEAYGKQYPNSSYTPNFLAYGYVSDSVLSDTINFNLIAGNVKGNADYGNPLTVSNSKNLGLNNVDLQDYSKHIFYLVNNKGETLTSAISIPVQIYANATNAKDAENAALKWINQQLNKYLKGDYDNISDDNVVQFLNEHHGDTLIFDEIINTKIPIPRNLLNCETSQDSHDDQDYATGVIDLAGNVEGESGITKEQIDALYQPTFYLNGDKSDLPNVKTTFPELTKYLQDFFGGDGSNLILIDSANDQDFPDKPLTAAENGTIYVASNRGVTNTDALPTKNVIIYKDGNGDVVGTQEVGGKPGDKVKTNVPDGYFNGDTTEVTIPENGIVTVNVVKKESSNGDVTNTDALPTKNVIVYKDGNGDVVGTQEITGNTGDKVTPKIPDGYFNGDTTEVTIPENGIVEVTVVKKESSSGDPLVQPELPTYTASNANVLTPDTPNNAPTQDGTDAGDKDTDTQKKPSVDRPDVDKPNVNKPSRGPVITKDTTSGAMGSPRIRNDINQGPLALKNIKQTKQKPSVKIADNNAKQNTLPQTGENSNVFAVIAGSFATVLGLFVLAKCKKRD